MSRFVAQPKPVKLAWFDVSKVPLLKQVVIDEQITLSLSDTLYAIDIGVKRMMANLRANTRERKQTHRNPWEITVQGVMGELAFHRLFQLDHDLDNTECRNAMNDTYDAQVGQITMDIKTTLSIYYDGNAPIRTPYWKKVKPSHVSVLMMWTNFPKTFISSGREGTNTVTEESIQLWAKMLEAYFKKESGQLPTFLYKGMVDAYQLFDKKQYNSFRSQYEVDQEDLKTWEECLANLRVKNQ